MLKSKSHSDSSPGAVGVKIPNIEFIFGRIGVQNKFIFFSNLYQIRWLAKQNGQFHIEVAAQAAESRGGDFLGVPPKAGYFGPESGPMKGQNPTSDGRHGEREGA